jgi:hypothetical protein
MFPVLPETNIIPAKRRIRFEQQINKAKDMKSVRQNTVPVPEKAVYFQKKSIHPVRIEISCTASVRNGCTSLTGLSILFSFKEVKRKSFPCSGVACSQADRRIAG